MGGSDSQWYLDRTLQICTTRDQKGNPVQYPDCLHGLCENIKCQSSCRSVPELKQDLYNVSHVSHVKGFSLRKAKGSGKVRKRDLLR